MMKMIILRQENFIKNYVLCTTIDPETMNTLENLPKNIDLNNAIIHMVRIVEIQIFNNEHLSTPFPEESDYPAIEKFTTKIMNLTAASLKINQEQIITKCFFEFNREKKIIEYLKEVNADLVVSVPRKKHGLFSSSFTKFLCHFSPCDVLVIRPDKSSGEGK